MNGTLALFIFRQINTGPLVPARSFSSAVVLHKNFTMAENNREKCCFCKIADGSQQSDIVYQDDDFVAFRDMRPAAPQHLLIVPREHIPSARDLTSQQQPLVEQLVALGRRLIQEKGVDNIEEELRLGFHWPPFTSIQHLHLHAIAPQSQMSYLSRLIFKHNSYWFVSPETVIQKLNKEAPAS
ncbi:HIT-like domain [Trinorchestia longiramus]|nr:HIT-like domain [Trinorchestia longiramus]